MASKQDNYYRINYLENGNLARFINNISEKLVKKTETSESTMIQNWAIKLFYIQTATFIILYRFLIFLKVSTYINNKTRCSAKGQILLHTKPE